MVLSGIVALALESTSMLYRLPLHRIRYADSHVHLDQYDDRAAAGLVARARAAGVREMLLVSTGVLSSRRTVALARGFPGVAAAVGVHPRNAGGMDVDAIRRLVAANRDVVRAVGEIGLDRDGGARAPLKAQTVAFQVQLGLAAAEGLPAVIHAVAAHKQVAAMLGAMRAQLPGVVIHYFAGAEDDLRRYLALDCHISFGRLLLKPEGEPLHRLVPLVPAQRLLVETDTYPLPGRQTEPMDVAGVVRLVAALRGEPLGRTAALTSDNFRSLFGPVPDLPAFRPLAVARRRARRLYRRARRRL